MESGYQFEPDIKEGKNFTVQTYPFCFTSNYHMTVRIGIIHNYYQSTIPSGENLTVNQIANYLKRLGHSVSFYSESSDRYQNNFKLQIIRTFRLNFPVRNNEFQNWLKEQDAIQVHNYFPLIGRNELRKLTKINIPITRVIHNYRKTCLSGNHYRRNDECHLCSMNSFKFGIIKKCYQKSFWKSLLVGTISRQINRFESSQVAHFVAISESVKEYLIRIGIDPLKIILIQNGIKKEKKISKNANEILFVSRLEPEKGIELTIKTWQANSKLPRLNIVGTGSLYNYVRDSTAKLSNVKFHGPLNAGEVELVAQKCRTLLAPLSWEEPFGRTLVEALSRGQSIVATKRGIVPFILQEGKNGFFCDLSVESIMTAISRTQDLDFITHSTYSVEKWEKNFSDEVVLNLWKTLYSDR